MVQFLIPTRGFANQQRGYLRVQNRLLYFVKYPEPGRVKTRLAKVFGYEKAASIYRLIAESNFKILQSCDDTDLAICFDPPDQEEKIKSWLSGNHQYYPQKGNGLGERLTNAFQDAFEEGAKKALAIGSDTLDLRIDLIDEAFRALKTHDIVLGPSKDGGYYLIGASHFEPSVFHDIPWSTSKVFESTAIRLDERRLSYHILDTLEDLDETSTFEHRKGDFYEILQ